VQHYKAVEFRVSLANRFRDTHPLRRVHVTAVDGRAEAHCFQCNAHACQLRHLLFQVVEIHGLKGATARVGHHADGTAGVDQ
jgi:hypothetical protein